jgi:hypothetical protein
MSLRRRPRQRGRHPTRKQRDPQIKLRAFCVSGAALMDRTNRRKIVLGAIISV